MIGKITKRASSLFPESSFCLYIYRNALPPFLLQIGSFGPRTRFWGTWFNCNIYFKFGNIYLGCTCGPGLAIYTCGPGSVSFCTFPVQSWSLDRWSGKSSNPPICEQKQFNPAIRLFNLKIERLCVLPKLWMAQGGKMSKYSQRKVLSIAIGPPTCCIKLNRIEWVIISFFLL